ncbi:hypothetical protein Ping_0922 [Psychromonas ingrahamii 37]|uniref:Uncharacterized protein n=1 Tax=Psychromonas ingrahamii (strain DSM 17664 / CCUG 51855 / 37) TaxID=357804 RepID=A1STE9_PSYIN|nr:hypothetical protein [Psychromonas ingrahamii]ABM02764.1 hypothetical protein Ping_0922 [Psychromonas ingrahamii 37]
MLKIKKIKLLSSAFFCIFVGQAVAQQPAQTKYRSVDFADPTAVYSKAGIGAGTEGVDVFGSFAGYLGWQMKHQLTLEAKHDLDYYNLNYMVFNSRNNSGFLLDSTWSYDYKGQSVDKTAFGVIKKVPLKNKKITLYPAMKLGMMWGNNISTTTYLDVEMAARYAVSDLFWIGATPRYLYALKGANVKEFKGTVDIGYELAENVGIEAHLDENAEFWANFTLAF